MNSTTFLTKRLVPDFSAYLELCKPKVVLLMLLTALVGMCLATSSAVPVYVLFWGNLGIALAAGAAAAVNHVIDRHIDIMMKRTQNRPIAQGKVSAVQALLFSFVLAVAGLGILYFLINPLSAVLTGMALIGYAGIYTLYLKRATPQNIVIGGLAGAAPPLLGWVCVTGQLDPHALLLVLIIYVWTPPHFWALAIHRHDDYQKAKIPMLTNTHGAPYTKLQIVLYTWLLVGVTILPFATGMSGTLYLLGVMLLNLRFLYWAYRLKSASGTMHAMSTFKFSIYYLMWLFVVLLADHYCTMF